MRQRVILLANGDIQDYELLRRRLQPLKAAEVIAADGGSRHAPLLGLQVGMLIGDLDSLEPVARSALAKAGARTHPVSPQKDEIDLELALLYAAEEGATHIVVLGATGGRFDMTLANVLLLTHPRLASVRVELWHGRQSAWLIRPPGGSVEGRAGDTLSLIPLNGDALGITTYNLAYPLRDESLVFGPARGVSNTLTAPEARLELRSGVLLAVHSPATT